MNEFDLIARFFTRLTADGTFVRQGIGDDCAILAAGEIDFAVTTDLLVEGTHFFPDADPQALGHKALAVNLSDLAAAGAMPACFFLALALPRADECWLAEFSKGLFALADEYACVLAGGDTTRAPQIADTPGPITICITALGRVPHGQALSRGAALSGDDLWVSGDVGAAALALAARRGEVELLSADAQACAARLDRPQPRVALGQALRGIAHAAIDISDGLLADLGHIAERSGVGAAVHWDSVPRAAALLSQPEARQRTCALAGGDDYELLFAAPAAHRARVESAARGARVHVTRIGSLTTARGIVVLDRGGERIDVRQHGFDHFA